LGSGLSAHAQLRPEVSIKPKEPPVTKPKPVKPPETQKPVTPESQKPPEPVPAQIVVETSPNAEVYLDDQFAGRASSQGRLVIDNPKPGAHTLRVSLAGNKDFQETLNVAAGQETKVAAALTDLPGRILVRSSPGAEVFLDDSRWGAVDTTGQLVIESVAPGAYEVRVSAPGKRDFRQHIGVSAGQEASIQASLADKGPTRPSTVIARNHDELVALARVSERDYFEFDLVRVKGRHKIGTVMVELAATNPRKRQFTVNLYFDDKRTTRKDRDVNAPVYFYVQGAPSALELVVNMLDQDSVSGYISTPKGLFPRTPNVLTPVAPLGRCRTLVC